MNTTLGMPALAVRATPAFKRQTAIGLAAPFLVPALLLTLSETSSRIDYQSGYRIAALVAFLLALFLTVGFSAPLWRPFFALTDKGLLVSGRHLIPWSLVQSATVVKVLDEPVFGFRLRSRTLEQLPPASRRAVTAGAYWPRARLAAAAPANGMTPSLAEVREALSRLGVALDDRNHKIVAE
jgi:hypothetical protein